VAEGYGRGSAKLGVPTANLPESLFAESLADVPAGVYFGWAGIGGAAWKAVANIGYSPTFAGAENAEKIIEAHLIGEDVPANFYGRELRILLVGSLRGERKFDEFGDLVAQINKDVADADAALDAYPLSGADADRVTGDPFRQYKEGMGPTEFERC